MQRFFADDDAGNWLAHAVLRAWASVHFSGHSRVDDTGRTRNLAHDWVFGRYRFFEPPQNCGWWPRKAQKSAVRGTQQPSAHDAAHYSSPEPTRGERHREESVMSASTAASVSVVLVHGGFVDGSGWQGVYNSLWQHGYRVGIVQNPTISLDDDVAVTKRVIAAQSGPVVLAGHSYGVIT
jgi:pimeloyl-ACP methyl ester carboxylesterase